MKSNQLSILNNGVKITSLLLFILLNVIITTELFGQNTPISSNTLERQKNITVVGQSIDSVTMVNIEAGVIKVELINSTAKSKTFNKNIEKNGSFRFEANSRDTIIINVFCLGYGSKTIKVTAKNDTTLKVFLNRQTMVLSEVKITDNSQLKLIPGGISIQPETKNFSPGTFLSTYLNYVPGLTLSQQGGISFLGTALEVYVDGRKLNISGPDLVTYLQQFSAKDLGKIDILTEPGSGYDASSKAVINFTTKKFNTAGLQNISSIGLTTHDKYYLNNSIVYGTKNVRLSANVIGNHSNFYDRNFYLISSETEPNLNRSQTLNYEETPLNNLGARVGIDAKISKKLQGGFNVLVSLTKKDYPFQFEIIDGSSVNRINSYTKSNSERFTQNGYLKYDVKKGSFQADFSNVFFKLNNNIENQGSSTSSNSNNSVNKNYYFNARQTFAFNDKFSLEGGVKFSNNSLNNTFVSTNIGASSQITNYNEKILAGYFLGSYSNKTFGIQAGLRVENTVSDLKNLNNSAFVNNLNYSNFFPSAILVFPSFMKTNVNFSFTSGISRPEYYQYLPFPNNLNDGSISNTFGNGKLMPTIANTIGLSLQRQLPNKNSIIFKITNAFVNSPFFSVPFLTNSGIVVVPFNTNSGTTLNAQFIYSKKWDVLSMTLSPKFTLSNLKLTTVRFNSQTQNLILNDVSSFSINSSITFKQFHGYNSSLSFSYGTRQYNPLSGYRESSGFSRLTVNKAFLDNKLTASLQLDDPFNWSRNYNTDIINGVRYYHANKPETRMLYLTLSYRIGSLKPTVQKYDYQEDSRLKQDPK